MQHIKTLMKNNERNAGRKKVLNGQRVIITVPTYKVFIKLIWQQFIK